MIVSDEPIHKIDLRRLKPLRDWLVIERIWVPDAVQAIIRPDIAQEKPHLGRVISVGPGAKWPDGTRRPMQVQIGDIVRYQSADVDTRDLVLLQEADVLFIDESGILCKGATDEKGSRNGTVQA